MLSFLKTDGGPHTPGQWAVMTASNIIKVVNPDAPNAADARRFELELLDILEKKFSDVQLDERKALANHLEYSWLPHLDSTVSDIIDCANDTEFKDHFTRLEVQAYLRNLIGQHLATAIDIERQWHCQLAGDHK